MHYNTYATLMNKKLVIASAKTPYFAIDRDFFVDLFAPVVQRIHVDESWYLAHSPDVREAIDRGEFASAADHFAKVGYYEHRMPYEIDVDEAWYLENYPDIADAVEKRVFSSGKAHFYEIGYREGRYPHANFTLERAGG